jgi:hypothetical protein
VYCLHRFSDSSFNYSSEGFVGQYILLAFLEEAGFKPFPEGNVPQAERGIFMLFLCFYFKFYFEVNLEKSFLSMEVWYLSSCFSHLEFHLFIIEFKDLTVDYFLQVSIQL